MTTPRRRNVLVELNGIARAEGRYLLDGPTAILKGVLESEIQIAGLVIDQKEDFSSAWRAAQDPEIATVMQRNRCVMLRRLTPERRLVEAGRLAHHGGTDAAAVAIIQNSELPRAAAAIERGGEHARPGTILLIVDDPEGHVAIASWPLLSELGIPILQPRNLDTLRSSIEQAARLVREVERPVAIVADQSLLRTLEVVAVRPNRMVETVDVAVAMRRRRIGRQGDKSDVIMLSRRMELNVTTSMPSPGEIEPLGLISSGIATTAVIHMLEDLRLFGRVPTLQLGLVHPIDPVSLERMLLRCASVVIVETRPGRLSGAILRIAEELRRAGKVVAELFWRDLPGDEGFSLEHGDAGRPSILVRKLMPQLQPIRSTLKVSERLADIDEWEKLASLPPRRPRRERIRLLGSIRRAVVSVDNDLRRGDEDHESIALMINGRLPTGSSSRMVSVEILERHDLLVQIVPMVASIGDRPWLLLIADGSGQEHLDVERIVGAAVPTDLPEPPIVRSISFRTEVELREQIKAAILGSQPSIIVVRRHTVGAALRTGLKQVDQLGYAPSVRMSAKIDQACGVRASEEIIEDRDIQSPADIAFHFEMDTSNRRFSGRWMVRIRSVLEVAEVVRTRPPVLSTTLTADRDLVAPAPVHARNGMWRAHVAGVRGEEQGAASMALAQAGLDMGFDVRMVWHPEPIGEGRTAWSQVLFTRPEHEESPPTRTAGVPYGEADLLLGIDPLETTRALGPDRLLRVATRGRTTIIANDEPLSDQRDEDMDSIVSLLHERVESTCGTPQDNLSSLVGVVERQFGNERLLDMVLLGFAFQNGVIPVSSSVMRSAVMKVEEDGFGRSLDAFEFGRQLSSGVRRTRSGEGVRDFEATMREVLLEARFSRGSRQAGVLRERLRVSLERMPGLLETESGREAAVDFIHAAASMLRWGGRRYVESYVTQVEQIYRSDRGDTGRDLTRKAILPLSESLLVRDLGYIVAVVMGLDHRRRVRRRLGVRTGRGDILDVVYVLKADIVGFGRRMRLLIPARTWLLRVISQIGRRLPEGLRGPRLGRRRKEIVRDSIRSAISESGDPVKYRYWCSYFDRLRDRVIEGKFHDLSPEEIKPLSTSK